MRLLSILLAILSLGIGPCDKHKLPQGAFKGEATIRIPGKTVNRQPVNVQLLSLRHGNGSIHVKNTLTQLDTLSPLSISQFHATQLKGPRGFNLIVPDLPVQMEENKIFRLTKVEHWKEKCYFGYNSDMTYHIRVCYGLKNQDFKLQISTIKGFHLIQIEAKNSESVINRIPLTDQTPHIFTTEQLIESAFQKNPDILLEQENLLQACESAHSAYERLLPHINLATFLTVWIPPWNASNFLKITGNLFPFIFPDKWLDASQLKWQSKAEEVVLDLTQSQKITALQNLAVIYSMQKELYHQLTDLHIQTQPLLVKIEELECQNRMDPGSSTNVHIGLNDLSNDMLDANNQIQSIGADIAQAIGSNHPGIVSDIVFTNEMTSFHEIPLLNPLQLAKLQRQLEDFAIDSSLEKKQMSYLQRAAEENEADIWTHWLNPNSEDRYSIGFHLGAEKKIASSKEKVFEIRIDLIEKSIRSLAYNRVRDRNMLLEHFERIKNDLPKRKDRFELFLNLVLNTPDQGEKATFRASDMRSALQDYRMGLKEYYSTQAAIQSQQIQIDRLVFKGPHQRFKKYIDEDSVWIENFGQNAGLFPTP